MKALAILAQQVAETVNGFDWQRIFGPVVGFVTAWLLFEVTEWRKVRKVHKELRIALVAELHHAEVLLSSIVGKYCFIAANAEEILAFAAEIRWFAKVGAPRAARLSITLQAPPAGALGQFDDLTDEKLVAFFSGLGPRETTGTWLILPVVDGVLAGRTSGFSGREIEALSTVRWQAHLLQQDAEWTKEFLRLSFTVTDEKNHPIVTENHSRRLHSYGRRAITLLGCTRAALRKLSATGRAEG